MKFSNLIALTCIVLGMSVGQLLFKQAARVFAQSDSLARGLLSPYLALAIFLYGILTLAWVWQLSMVDLSRAFPFMALTFAVVPLLSTIFLGEPTSPRYWGGVGLMVVGIILAQSDT